MKKLLVISGIILASVSPLLGEKFVFENIEKRGDGFVRQIDKFGAKMDDALNYTTDIKLKPSLSHPNGLNLEYKSWKKDTYGKLINGDQFKNQLKNYIQHGDFEYVADAKKLLRDVVPDPSKFVREQFQGVFKKNAKELFEQNPNFFKQFKGIDGKTIESLPAFEKLVQNESFVKQLSNFIKIE